MHDLIHMEILIFNFLPQNTIPRINVLCGFIIQRLIGYAFREHSLLDAVIIFRFRIGFLLVRFFRIILFSIFIVCRIYNDQCVLPMRFKQGRKML